MNLNMSKKFIRLNILNISILIFIIVFSALHMMKPTFLYDDDGSFRQFGLGYRHKTVIPMWIMAIVLAIFSYLFVLHLLR